MTALITFALSNFSLTFTLLGLLVAGIQILRTPHPRPPGSSAEAVLRWFLFFSIGVSFFYNFVCHVFLGDMSARFIGWAQSPFQAEVGWASLGYSVLGFMAFRPNRGLRIGTIADLIRYRLEKDESVERISEQVVDTEFGPFRMLCYEDHVNRNVHVALVRGRCDADTPVLVRVHVTDTLGDVLGIQSPQLGWPLRDAMRRIAAEPAGVVVVLRNPESPRDFMGMVAALAGSPAEPDGRRDRGEVLRTYGTGAQILRNLGVRRMRVLSAPKQMHGISGFGLEVVDYVYPD